MGFFNIGRQALTMPAFASTNVQMPRGMKL